MCSLSTVRQWLKSRGHSNPDNLYLVTDKGKIISPTDNAMDIYNAFFQPVSTQHNIIQSALI